MLWFLSLGAVSWLTACSACAFLANTAKYEDPSRGIVVTEKTIEALQNKHIPVLCCPTNADAAIGPWASEVAGQNASYCDPKGLITTSGWSVNVAYRLQRSQWLVKLWNSSRI
jgi:hypothetical protein